jgi:hypothetical protein
MRKLDRILPKYLLYSSPAVAAMFVWGLVQGQAGTTWADNALLWAVRELLSWHLMFWFLALMFALVLLVVSPGFRESILSRLTRIEDRDERESYMVGRAGRYAFFSTLALLIFLLFFSVINIRVVRLPAERAIDGKRHQLSIGLSFNLLEEAKPGGDIQDAERLFSKDGIPLSKQSLLLLIAAWHAGSFAYFSRKQRSDA